MPSSRVAEFEHNVPDVLFSKPQVSHGIAKGYPIRLNPFHEKREFLIKNILYKILHIIQG